MQAPGGVVGTADLVAPLLRCLAHGVIEGLVSMERARATTYANRVR